MRRRVAARLAITVACRRGVPSARPAASAPWSPGPCTRRPRRCSSAAALAAAAALGWIYAVAIAAGLAVSLALTALAVRRLGGITGDVLGALAEVTTAACLLVTALA